MTKRERGREGGPSECLHEANTPVLLCCWPLKRPMGQSLLLCGAYCGLHHHHVVVATTNAILCVRAAGGFFVTHPTCPFHCSARCCRGIFFNPGFLWTGVHGLLRVSPILITLVSRLPIRGSQSSHCPDQVWMSCTLIRIFTALDLDWPLLFPLLSV